MYSLSFRSLELGFLRILRYCLADGVIERKNLLGDLEICLPGAHGDPALGLAVQIVSLGRCYLGAMRATVTPLPPAWTVFNQFKTEMFQLEVLFVCLSV